MTGDVRFSPDLPDLASGARLRRHPRRGRADHQRRDHGRPMRSPATDSKVRSAPATSATSRSNLLPKVTDRVVTVSSMMHWSPAGSASRTPQLEGPAVPRPGWPTASPNWPTCCSPWWCSVGSARPVRRGRMRPPRLFGHQPAGAYGQPDHPGGISATGVRDQCRVRRQPDPVRGVAGPAAGQLHRPWIRGPRPVGPVGRSPLACHDETAARCGGCPNDSPTPNSVVAGNRISAGHGTVGWRTLGRRHGEVVRPPLSARLEALSGFGRCPAFVVQTRPTKAEHSHGRRRHHQQARRRGAHPYRQEGASRQTARTAKVPAVLYGHGAEPRHINLNAHDFAAVLRHSGTKRRPRPADGRQGRTARCPRPSLFIRCAATSSMST